MKKTLTALLILFFVPSFALAMRPIRKVEVANEVDVNVKSLPDGSLEMGNGFLPENIGCDVVPGDHRCFDAAFVSSTSEKLIHWATVSVLAEPGFSCRATLLINDNSSSGTINRRLLRVYATDVSPGVATITLPRPIRIEDIDGLGLSVVELSFQQQGCRGDATVGVEEVAP